MSKLFNFLFGNRGMRGGKIKTADKYKDTDGKFTAESVANARDDAAKHIGKLKGELEALREQVQNLTAKKFETGGQGIEIITAVQNFKNVYDTAKNGKIRKARVFGMDPDAIGFPDLDLPTFSRDNWKKFSQQVIQFLNDFTTKLPELDVKFNDALKT